MQIEYIRRPETVRAVRDKILASDTHGNDCETTGLDPLVDKLRLLQISPTPDDVIIFDLFHLNLNDDCFNWLPDYFGSPRATKVFHNGKFDIRFLKRARPGLRFEAVYDTYLGSQLLACGDDTEFHGLRDVAARFGGRLLDKTEQRSNFGAAELYDEQLRYAALDASVLHDVRAGQNRHFAAANLERVALLEFDAVETVADLENNGFYLDANEWLTRCRAQTLQRTTAGERLHQAFASVSRQGSMFGGSDFNLDSPDDISVALKALGVPIEDSTLARKLKAQAAKFPVCQDVMDYRELATALKTFGPDYPIKFIHPVTGRVHADFHQVGTPTGRFTCSQPNLQQIPQEPEYRNCFQAPDALRTLIKADYSQIELRLMAQFSRDPKLCGVYERDEDLHTYTATQVFTLLEGRPIAAADVTTEQRHLGKGLNFGTAYGIGAKRFAEGSGISEKQAGALIEAFYKSYDVLDGALRAAGQRAVDELEAHSYSGRTWRFWYERTDKQSVGAVERLGRNFWIQASCSDIMKRALYLIRPMLRRYDDVKLVNIVHDEIILECSTAEAEQVAHELELTMQQAGQEVLTAVPCKVDTEVLTKWKK